MISSQTVEGNIIILCEKGEMNMRIWKKLTAIAIAGVMTMSLVACGNSDTNTSSSGGSDSSSVSGTVTGSGSSALLPLAQNAADAFKEKNPDVSITLNAGGSGTGLKQVSDGTVDIGNSDVAAEDKLEAAQASELVDHKVCVVTMAPVINHDLAADIKSLTKQQLIDIFTGKVKNWNEVGGPDEEILLVTRPETSGTRALFQEYALDGNEEAAGSALETDDSGTLIQSVADNKGAIGYVALSYLVNNDKVSTVAIDGVEPTLENTYNGTYPVWGYEHMYTKGEATGAVKAYIDYIMSDEYSGRLEEQGYGVTSKMTVQR